MSGTLARSDNGDAEVGGGDAGGDVAEGARRATPGAPEQQHRPRRAAARRG